MKENEARVWPMIVRVNGANGTQMIDNARYRTYLGDRLVRLANFGRPSWHLGWRTQGKTHRLRNLLCCRTTGPGDDNVVILISPAISDAFHFGVSLPSEVQNRWRRHCLSKVIAELLHPVLEI